MYIVRITFDPLLQNLCKLKPDLLNLHRINLQQSDGKTLLPATSSLLICFFVYFIWNISIVYQFSFAIGLYAHSGIEILVFKLTLLLMLCCLQFNCKLVGLFDRNATRILFIIKADFRRLKECVSSRKIIFQSILNACVENNFNWDLATANLFWLPKGKKVNYFTVLKKKLI